MKLLLEQKIQAGFAVALAFLCLAGGAAWWSARRNVETFGWVDHTYQTLGQIEETLVRLVDAETVTRGFVISGDESFLEPYQAGLAAMQKSFEAVRGLTRESSDQQRRLLLLEPLIQEKIKFMNSVVERHRNGDATGAIQLVKSGNGKRTMDQIRGLLREMEDEERRMLEQRSARSHAANRTTVAVVLFGSLLAIALVGLADLVVKRDLRKRQQAEQERDRFFNLSLDLLCIASTDGFFKRINPAFHETLGWSDKELLARPFLDFVHPDDNAESVRELEHLTAGRMAVHFRNRYQCQDGSWRWLSWNAVPQPDGLIYATARDITPLQEAEDALRRSEQSLDVTLHSIGDAVLATDTSGKITRLNPVAEHLTGWSITEALGRPIREVFNIIGEVTRQPSVIPVDEVLATGKVQGLANHTLLIARDGTERPIADSAAPIRDREGEIIGVVLVFRDVTAEHAAAKALRASEEYNRSIVESGQDCLKVLSLEGRILDMAEPGRRLMGVTDFETIRNADWISFWNGDDLAAARRALAAACDGVSGRFQGFTPTLDGTPKWWDVVISPILDSDGKPERLLGVSRDITAQHEAQEEIRQLNADLERRVQERTAELREAAATARRTGDQLEAVIQAMQDGVFVYDKDGNAVLINDGAVRLVGFPSAAELKQNMADFVELLEFSDLAGEPVSIEQWPVSRVLRGQTLNNWELRLRRKDLGREWFIAFSGAPVRDEQGQQVLAVVITRDITERQQVLMQLKQTADDLRTANSTIEQERSQLALRVAERTLDLTTANAQLEQASRFKSEFLANMSHELRTPLNGILGMNELLQRTELTAEQRKFISACTLSGQTLLQLINDILDLSKIEAGKLELNPRECSLEALTYDVITIFSHAAKQKGLTLTCEVDPQACVTAECDDHRLRQILVNLLGNALKFTASGNVTLRAQCRPANDNRSFVRFSITDTGVGIPQAKVDRLFSAFSQVDSSTARQFGGTGLGLSISKQLVELMGGTIGVESRLGAGSTFWFEIPLQFIAGDADVARMRQLLDGTRVLAVDGIDRDRRQIGECLEAWGCPVEQVTTVREALDAVSCAEAEGTPFAVVLADCRLTVGDEYIVLQELAKHSHLPIIGLGTDEDGESAAYLHRLGVRHLLTDPVRPSTLFDAITSVLSVSVPSLTTSKAQATAAIEPSAPVSGHILVAEDNQINQMFVIELLKHCGCTCDVTGNGDEALVAVRQKRYDLVLMDCQMPEMDGFTASREIRRREAADGTSRRIPIIALTANALKGDRERCLEAGMDDYLTKPLQAAGLRAVLTKYLGQSAPERSACDVSGKSTDISLSLEN